MLVSLTQNWVLNMSFWWPMKALNVWTVFSPKLGWVREVDHKTFYWLLIKFSKIVAQTDTNSTTL